MELKRGYTQREILEECIDRHRHNKEDESETRLVHEVSRLCNTRNDYDHINRRLNKVNLVHGHKSEYVKVSEFMI